MATAPSYRRLRFNQWDINKHLKGTLMAGKIDRREISSFMALDEKCWSRVEFDRSLGWQM